MYVVTVWSSGTRWLILYAFFRCIALLYGLVEHGGWHTDSPFRCTLLLFGLVEHGGWHPDANFRCMLLLNDMVEHGGWYSDVWN